ncbi:MAG TPA: YetF domain-containing protein [Puia sp.]|nr:YetF domain-containing protein [Puia sp.]
MVSIFGEGRDLNILQMTCRGIVIFFVALLLIRISGRRSFGVRTPLDNIISISLGAILSRAVVGASEFLPVVVCSLAIVCLHRFCSWLIVRHETIARIFEGNKMLLFSDGHFIRKNVSRALVSEEDIREGIRKSALTDDLDQIDKVYIERNGEISAIKK